ncbi:MAG: hypothetical protein AAFO83_03335 [Cyanobacteria bacterium J06607_13]
MLIVEILFTEGIFAGTCSGDRPLTSGLAQGENMVWCGDSDGVVCDRNFLRLEIELLKSGCIDRGREWPGDVSTISQETAADVPAEPTGAAVPPPCSAFGSGGKVTAQAPNSDDNTATVTRGLICMISLPVVLLNYTLRTECTMIVASAIEIVEEIKATFRIGYVRHWQAAQPSPYLMI